MLLPPHFSFFFVILRPMKHELSILIPTYNGDCRQQVKKLWQQAEAIEGLSYEIIVADDGSTDKTQVARCQEIEALPHCRFIIRQENAGRAVIRNFLARQARYEWMLFIDCDMTIVCDNFVSHYLEHEDGDVVYGGYVVGNGEPSCLRYVYEMACASQHTAEERRKRPYQHLHTCNFLVRRSVMLTHPFDERFHHYGYEDVLFGKQLRLAGIRVVHTENPVGFYDFEDNTHFISKTEEGLRTLYEFRNELRGYSQLLTFTEGIHLSVVRGTIKLWHRLFGALERRYLCSCKPSLSIFNLYKLGYYLTLKS